MTKHAGQRVNEPGADDPRDTSRAGGGLSLTTAILRSSDGIAGQSAESIPPLLARLLMQTAAVAGAAVWLVAADGTTLRCRAMEGQPNGIGPIGERFDIGASLLGRMLRGAQPSQTPITVLLGEVLLTPAAPPALRGFTGVPLLRRDQALGILGLFTTRPLTSGELALLAALGQQVATELSVAAGPGPPA
ncbi:MAG: GAF domain-containing protein [Sphaerobacter sp.]|nr:GAF domain-containing protein [Sphaerobacter sp.]